MRNYRCFLVGILLIIPGMAYGDWPGYRGPSGNGNAIMSGGVRGLPVTWSETTNVTWKTPVPYLGWSTPVILAGQVWLTTATEDGHDFYVVCLDVETGKVISKQKVFHSDSPEPLGNDLNSYASPSPVIEAGRVYVHYGSYGTACLDTGTGKLLWKRSDLPCRHYRGPASSPVLYNDLLILTMDGVDQQYLIALDKKTGQTVWRTERTTDWNDLDSDGKPISDGDLRKAFSTPLIVAFENRTEMISAGAKALYGYDPANGRELWKIRYEGHSASARPLSGNGLAYFTTGFGKTELIALRLGGHGDVTDSHIAWRTTRGVPRMPSPVLVDDLLFMINDNGIATCLEAATGHEVWKERIGGEYAASLLYGDGRIYCCSQEGKTTVLKAGRNYEILATNMLESGFMASPAVYGAALILRTKTSLYRIETDSEGTP